MVTVLVMGLSFFFLTQAVKTLPVGTAYAVWTGIGAVMLGMIPFTGPGEPLRLVCIGLIIAGIVGPGPAFGDG